MHRVLNPSVCNSVPPGLCALGIMTKVPRAGVVKTRLQPPLTPEEAAALNICFLRDTARSIGNAGPYVRGVGVFTPPGNEKHYAEILPAHFDLLPQREGDFGERLAQAIDDLFRIGFESCCLIDSDSPTVTPEVFRAAVDFLRSNDNPLVLGPSDDGGYYLIGMRKLHRRVFEEIDWSTESVLAQTKERGRELGLGIEILPTFFDVDDRATLRRLCRELLGQNRDSAPVTKAFLQQLIAREGRERIWPQ
jgi:uncharacterized protein